MKGIQRGAKLYVVDPRRTSSAAWADGHLGLDVGTDIALANAVGHAILEAGLENRAFIERATIDFDAYAAEVQAYSPERVEKITGVSAASIRKMAHDYAKADRAMICWTLGITEHHTAVDNVLSLINLALLTGHVGRPGSGVNPLRGQNNVQGGGDMGALPHKLPGFQDVEDDAVRARFDAAYGVAIPSHKGWHLTEMFEAMERKDLTSLYVIGENPAQSEADGSRTHRLLSGLEILVVQDILLTKTAEMADVVFPATASWCETDGTVTNSERRVQRVRKALAAPGEARDDVAIIAALSQRLGHELGIGTPEEAWNELRTLSPMHRGMSYARLEDNHGIQWPCPSDDHPGTKYLHARLWAEPLEGPPAGFHAIAHRGPIEELDATYPLRLTTGRRLESFNTGVQTNGFSSPLHRRESLDLHPDDAAKYDVADGESVRISSRRGSVVAHVRLDDTLKPGLAFMTFHFPDEVDTNQLTIDAWDPKSGTAEFKAAAIRIDKLGAPAPTRSAHIDAEE